MEMDDGQIQTGEGCGEPSAPYKVILATAPVRATVHTRSMARFAHGPQARVCAIAIRHENAPRWMQQSCVDGENVDGKRCVNLERTGPHAGACSVRGTRGAGSQDDALVRDYTGNRAGSVRG